MNYYEHHLGDFARDTLHLSMLEEGAYRRLLDAYYIRERALPGDVRECCKLARAAAKAERDAVAYVLREFFVLRDGLHHQSRANAEIARFQDKQAKARASAEKRWAHTERNANASPNAMRTHSGGTANGDADGMHRAPVPSPQTPVSIHERPRGSARERAQQPLPCPEGVDRQTWVDWLALRKAKKAPVTATVIAGAVAEAAKAGMPLGAFLAEWCARGSQGLRAEWLTPPAAAKRVNGADEPAWRREQRERNEALLGPFSAAAAAKRRTNVVDMEDANAAAIRLG